MAVTTDLPLTLGRNAISLSYASDIIDRASRIAPISVPLGGEMTPLGYARWAIASPDSGTKTFTPEDPAGGASPVGFDNQLIGWYVLLERTGEAFQIVASTVDPPTLVLATWSSSLIAGEIFQFRLTVPGTIYTGFSYRTSVASVLPPPPGIPIQDAEVTGLAGTVLTIRDGWLFGGAGPVTVDGEHVGRAVRLSNFVAVDAITDFAVVGGTYVYWFADVSAYQVGDWMRRAAETDGGFSHGDINTLITSAFPAAMTIVAVDPDANTVTVVSRDGLNRVIYDTAVNGPDYNIIRIYRPLADLKTVTASTASPKTLTLDDTTDFTIATDDGAVEILIASTSTSGKVPWYLDHPTYIQLPPTGIGQKFRTIDRSQDPTAYLGVQNLIANGIGRVQSTPGALPDGWLGAPSLGQAGTATPSNFIITKNIDPLFIKTGAQSWFFSTANGVIYFTPLPWTPMYASQRMSARVSLLLTKWTGNAPFLELRMGIMQADGTVIPWRDQKRAVLVQPADATSPRPDPYQKFVANVYDDLVLNDFDITEPSTYPVTNRPNVGDIANMGAGVGLVLCLVVAGNGTTVEGYIGGAAMVTAHEAPPNVQEFYEANKLHQDVNKALAKVGPPQPKISVDFYDAKAMNPTLDEPDAKKGVMALIDGVGLGISNLRRRITDVKRNFNEPGRTQITLDENKLSLAAATAKPPSTKPTAGGTSGTTPGGSSTPTLTLRVVWAGAIPTVFADVDASVRSVQFAATLNTTEPTAEAVAAATPTVAIPFKLVGSAMALGDTWRVAAVGKNANGDQTGLARIEVTLALTPPWLYTRSRTNYWQDAAKTIAATINDPVYTWGAAPGTTRDLVHRYPSIPGFRPLVQQNGAALRFGDENMVGTDFPAPTRKRGAFLIPDMTGFSAAELFLVLQRAAFPISDSDGGALMQFGGVDLFPRQADGHWISGFCSNKSYDLGALASAIANGSDGPHVVRLVSNAERWAAYLDGTLIPGSEDLSPSPLFPTTGAVLGESGSGLHWNGWLWSVTIIKGTLNDADAAAWTGQVISDATGTPPDDGGDDGGDTPPPPAGAAGNEGDVQYNHAGALAGKPFRDFGRWEPLANGDPDTPELIFGGGDVIMGFVPGT